MKRGLGDKAAVGVGIIGLFLIVVAILLKLAILVAVIWGLVELAQYLSSLT